MSDTGQSGFGATLSGATTGTIGQVRNITIPDADVGDIDITTNDATNGWQSFIAGIKSSGKLQLDVVYAPAVTAAVITNLGNTPEVWSVTFSAGSFSVSGFIDSIGQAIPHDKEITQTITIQTTGAPTFTA